MSLGTSAKARSRSGADQWGRYRRYERKLAPYLFVSPFFVLFAIFLAWPVVNSFILSFFSQDGFGVTPSFRGLGNYADLLTDDRFLHALRNTTAYALGSLLIIVPLALLLAVGLHAQKTRYSTILRVGYFLPLVTSPVVIAVVFAGIYEQTYGWLNAGLAVFHLPKVGWLNDPVPALFAIIILLVWQFLGINALYFLAGLQSIPHELQEAARVDGAGTLTVFRHITLPLLRPVTIFVLVQAIIGSYQIFAQPQLLTGGGPEDATLSIVQYLYSEGFNNLRFGYGSAVAYTLVVIILILSLIQLRVTGAFSQDA